MEAILSVKLFVLLVCGIHNCVSYSSVNSEPNLDVKLLLSEFEDRYDALRMELRSEIENRKNSEAVLKNKINELKQSGLKHIDEISQLKTELDHTKNEVKTLTLKIDGYETAVNKCNAKLKTITQLIDQVQVQGSQNERIMTDKQVSKFMNDEFLQKNRGNADPETLTDEGAPPHMIDSTTPGEKSTQEYYKDKRRLPKVNRRQLNRSNGTHVAFFARLTPRNTPNLQPGQNIIFDNVLTNIGNGYNSINGIFMAPIAGVYVFHASVLSNSVHCHTNLMKNTQVLARFETHEIYDHASHIAIVEVQAGDNITVQNADWTNRSYYGSYFSTFSGFLLYNYELPEPEVILGK